MCLRDVGGCSGSIETKTKTKFKDADGVIVSEDIDVNSPLEW